jgi:hypothetical protein
MALAKPTIATNYSGNLEFMRPENSYLCGFTRVPVGRGREPYPPASTWAEPDLADAARLLRHVYDQPEEARARGALAARDIQETHSLTRAGVSVRSRIETIRRRRSNVAASMPSIELLQDQLETLQAENSRLAAEVAARKARS